MLHKKQVTMVYSFIWVENFKYDIMFYVKSGNKITPVVPEDVNYVVYGASSFD